MRTCFIVIISILLALGSSFSQVKRDYVWTIGDNGSSGVPHPEFGGANINFNREPIEVERIERIKLSFGSNSSSISNKSGELLFFTDGCFVYGTNNMLIKNGDVINEGRFRDRCTIGNGYISGNASTIFLPDPANKSEYYLVHQRVEEIGSLAFSTLLYSKIALNTNGVREITESNIPISGVNTYLGEMAAVKHANGEDWWVIVPEDSTDIYQVILIDETGVRKSFEQKIGNRIGFLGTGTGQCKFSPDGKKFARWTSTQQLLVADFDRSTGTFSNDEQIMVIGTTFRGGVEFSPNSRFLYVASTYQVHQFDMWEDDIPASQTLVAEWDGYQDFVRTFFSRLQLTPDCRIFISLPGSHRFWHVIENPNEKGINCNVVQRGLLLKTWTFNTMPYFPNYSLGPIGNEGYPCDSTKVTVSSTEVPIFERNAFVYPNPTQGQLYIDLPRQVGDIDFQLFSAAGQQVFAQSGNLTNEAIELGHLPKGIYFYRILNQEGRVWSGKVVLNGL